MHRTETFRQCRIINRSLRINSFDSFDRDRQQLHCFVVSNLHRIENQSWPSEKPLEVTAATPKSTSNSSRTQQSDKAWKTADRPLQELVYRTCFFNQLLNLPKFWDYVQHPIEGLLLRLWQHLLTKTSDLRSERSLVLRESRNIIRSTCSPEVNSRYLPEFSTVCVTKTYNRCQSLSQTVNGCLHGWYMYFALRSRSFLEGTNSTSITQCWCRYLKDCLLLKGFGFLAFRPRIHLLLSSTRQIFSKLGYQSFVSVGELKCLAKLVTMSFWMYHTC